MDKLIIIMGKSGTGKDTIARAILAARPDIKPLIPYTTRPRRDGEGGGYYHFVTDAQMDALEKLEERVYDTVRGKWRYATAAPEEDGTFLLVTTPEAEKKIQGKIPVFSIYLRTGDKTRLLRSIGRLTEPNSPDYAEICRRYLADEQDFQNITADLTIDTEQPVEKTLSIILDKI